jgi:hypothetical protein
MKTLRRYDRVNVDRGELRLIRVGHALRAILKRDRAKNGGTLRKATLSGRHWQLSGD